jgi:lysophospholipase L1-like esterase
VTQKARPVFYVITLLLPLLILAGIEGGLRLIGFGQVVPLVIESDTFPGYSQPNPSYIQRYFPLPEMAPAVSPDTVFFRTDKAPGSIRIVIQGGSTAAGFPYGRWGSLQGMLDQRFKRLYPTQDIEIINTAMSSINSYTLLDSVDEVLDLQPDLVLIYAGHNEFLGVMGVGSAFATKGGRSLTLLWLALRDVRLVQLLERIFAFMAQTVPADPDDQRTLMSQIAREKVIPTDSGLYHAGIEQFRENLARILERYQQAGVPVIIGTLASNEMDQPPFDSVAVAGGSDNGPDSNPDQDRSSPLGTVAADFYRAGLKAAREGDNDTAKNSFIMARDNDTLRFRAPSVFNDLIREQVSLGRARLADVEGYLRADTSNGIIGKRHMLEHLHPNPRGYFLLAEAFVDAIAASGVIKAVPERFPREQAWREIPLTETDRILARYKIARLTSNYPFVPQNTASPPPLPSGSFAKDMAAKRAQGGNWVETQQLLLQHYQESNRPDQAAVIAAMLSEALPGKAQPRHAAGQLYRRANELDLSLFYHRKAVRYEPNNVRYRLALAQTEYQLGRYADAVASLDAVLRMDPGHAAAKQYRALAAGQIKAAPE